MKHRMILGLGLVLFGGAIAAQEPEPVAAKSERGEATLNIQTTVTGNQEQPRVLYILPWQSPGDSTIEFESMHSLQEEAFSHLERDEFRRQLSADSTINQTATAQDEAKP